MTIHHAIVGKVRKAGFEIIETDGQFLIQDSAGKNSQLFPSAKEAADAIGVEGEGALVFGRAPKANPNKNGVMGTDYHKRYMEQGGGSGDILDVQLRVAVRGEDGKVDTAKVRQIAEDNGVWNEAWIGLNPGMQRMNLANRLRALVRRDGNNEISFGGQTGRFGIEFKPSAREEKKAGAAERKAARNAANAEKRDAKAQAKADKAAEKAREAAAKAEAKAAKVEVPEGEGVVETTEVAPKAKAVVNRAAKDRAAGEAKVARSRKK